MVNYIEENEISKVLFVDDEENILNSIKRNMHNARFLVFTAPSAKRAYKILELENIDIVISDYKMPEIDGIQC